MADPAIVEKNWQAISNAWSEIEPKIISNKDLGTLQIVDVDIQLATGIQQMKLVLRRSYVSVMEFSFAYTLDLFRNGSELIGRAPSGLMIIWAHKRDHHCIYTTEARTLLGFTGYGLGSSLIKLSDRIIINQLIPLTTLDHNYQNLPIYGVIEDCAHDLNGKVTHWTTFCAERLGYTVTGKNENGWPLLTKRFCI